MASEPVPRLRRRHLAGLPGERTLLAWDRTALALLANAALLVMRDAGDSHPLRLVAASIAALLAAMCGVLARSRARVLADATTRAQLRSPVVPVILLTGGVCVLAALEIASIVRA